MSTVLERIADMEERLLKHMPEGTPEQDDKAEAAVHRFAMLVAQAVYVSTRLEDEPDQAWIEACAREVYPLPPKRVLREEPDPHGNNRWRVFDNEVQWWSVVRGGWMTVGAHDSGPALTAERAILIADLLREPSREVPDNGEDPVNENVFKELAEALRPFAEMAETGFVGSAYEGAEDSKAVLVHHASGRVVTVGDFERGAEAYRTYVRQFQGRGP
jgi:hypothetical protein